MKQSTTTKHGNKDTAPTTANTVIITSFFGAVGKFLLFLVIPPKLSVSTSI